MKNWKNWLPPVLTALTVACLAVLPLRLSRLQDGKFTGAVHAEELGAYSNFPARPPELPGRIGLLAQWRDLPESIFSVGRVLEGETLEEAGEQLQWELKRLVEEEVLPELGTDFSGDLVGERIYLRNQQDLSSAAFLRLDAYDKINGAYLCAVLDGETERVLALELGAGAVRKDGSSLPAAGGKFLDGLGLSYEAGQTERTGESVSFHLPGEKTIYQFNRWSGGLQIFPGIDWHAMDEVDSTPHNTVYGFD